jgi:hypothetical protein
VAPFWLKVAVTARAAVMLTVQGSVVLQEIPLPLQPEKV